VNSDQVKNKALEVGFDLAGVTAADPIDIDNRHYFEKWLNDGRAGGMAYMRNHTDKRFAPAKLLTGAKSVICVAIKYSNPPLPPLGCKIAAFARFEDYHIIMKEMLFELASLIQAEHPRRIGFKACVDSVPIAERALAQRAGLGFIGRNYILINPDLGSRLLLGELITTLELEPDSPIDHPGCGTCQRCIEACPNGALEPEGGFDSRKCISYLTIESKDMAPPDRRADLKNYVYGCDECLNACPYNKPGTSANCRLRLHPEWTDLTPQQILNITEFEFARRFAGSGLIRLGLERLKRNCMAVTDLNVAK